MKNLFKYLLNNTKCQKSGICSKDPVINAIEAVITNEIRQTAFYIVKLNELNLTNLNVIKETIFALTVNISDININKTDILNFYSRIKNIKEETRNIYIKKSNDTGISYEFITPVFDKDPIDTIEIIKGGENIIREFYNTINEEKFRLIKLIILTAKMAALKLVDLSEYKDVDIKYYYETLRLFSLVNYKTVREEKLIRRLKEFSEILYEIQDELDFELNKKFGKRQKGIVKTDICKGHSILVSGFDIDEFYNLLEQTKNENINIYINPSLINVIFYPKTFEYPNFKGIFGINEAEVDFSKFKGVIYITQNSNQPLDFAFRGSIYTTKIIPYDKAIKIEKNNLKPLIDEAKKLDGFDEFTKGVTIDFEYNIDEIKKRIENIENKKVLIYLGLIEDEVKEKFIDYEIINFLYPYETEGLYYILKHLKTENISIYFSECTRQTISTIISLINKNFSEIYMANCTLSDINPHIINSLDKDFNIKML